MFLYLKQHFQCMTCNGMFLDRSIATFREYFILSPSLILTKHTHIIKEEFLTL